MASIDPAGRIVIEAEIELSQRSVQQLQSNFERISQAVQRSINPASKASEQLNREIEDLGKTTERTTRRFTTFGGSLDDMEKALITVAIAATQVGRTLSRMITQPILNTLREGTKAASDLTESINLTTIVFGESSDQIIEWAKNLDTAFGITQREALQARSNFASFFDSIGLGLSESIELSGQLVERIGDIASALNIPVPEVIQRIQSGLVGQTEAVRRLNIEISEETLKREALRRGIVAQGEALTAEQKVTLRANLILEQSNELLDDAINTSGTYAGTIRELRVVKENFSRALAETFLPVLTAVNKVLIQVLEAFTNLAPPIRAAIVVVGVFAAALGPLLIILGQTASVTLALRAGLELVSKAMVSAGLIAAGTAPSFGALAAAISATLLPLLPFIAIGAAVALVLVRMFQTSEDFRNAVNNLFSSIGNLASELLNLASSILTPLIETVTILVDSFSGLATPVIATSIENLARNFQTLADIVEIVTVLIEKLLGLLTQTQTQTEQLGQSFIDMIPGVGVLGNVLGFLNDKLVDSELFGRANIAVWQEWLGIEPKVRDGVKETTDALDGQASALDLFSASLDSANNILKESIKVQERLIGLQDRVAAAQRGLTSAANAVRSAQERVQRVIESVADAHERLADAHGRLAEAQERVAELTSDLIALESERLALIRDTARDIRELEEAQDDLANSQLRLLDIESERRDVLERIAELQTPASADEIARADRRVERAKIALNRAIRDEEAFLRSLNEQQREGVDLSGLTLDQLRVRLSDIRASLAAQRAVTRQTKSQVEIEEERTEKRLNVVEAQERLNQLVEDREELDQRVINNQREIERLTRRLESIDISRRKIIRDIGDNQQRVNNIRAGETSRARDIEIIDGRILTLKKNQESAVKGVETATKNIVTAEKNIETAVRNVATAQNAVKTAVDRVRDAQLQVLKAKEDQRFQSTLLLGSEQEINQALRDRIGINAQLLNQSAAASLAQSLQAALPTLFPNNPFALNNPAFARQLADAILNNPNRLRELLRALGSAGGFAEGGLITKPMLANIGENFKHEMVLPLTKPDRVWSLMAKTLPKYPGALRAAQAALSPGSPTPVLPKAIASGGNRVIRRADGPATYGQFQELINLLKVHKSEVHVEAPITIEDKTGDSDLLAKKVSRQLENNVIKRLSRR